MHKSTSTGPFKALDEKSLAEGGQRWRFIPLRTRLDSTSARPSALPALDFEGNLADVSPDDTLFSHFAATLQSSADINSTASFSDYVQQVKPLSLSLPLVFRNRKKLVTLTLDALHTSTENGAEATGAIANCLTALSKDLGPQQFHPFFPRIVEEFSSVFDRSKGVQGGGKAGGPKAVMFSVFWDPEVSMVPLFAALAEITKGHLQYLAADPKGTLQSLLPLLSNSHYRVREMTAESCLGYLIRKTRDLGVIKRLTESIASVCVATSASKDALVDGLGAALFEGVRLPSGRLHSRAREVLSFVLGHLLEAGDEKKVDPHITPAVLKRMLAVVSRCYAGLSVHLNEAADVQALYDTLLTASEHAKTEQNVFQAGNVAFLLRKSLQRGRCMLTALNPPSLQKILNALSALAHCFKEDPRVVYESLGALAAVIINSPESRQGDSALRAFSASGAKVASSSQVASLTAAMAVFLRMRLSFRGRGKFVAVDQSYGLLCEQLARLPSDEVEKDESSRLNTNSRRALQAALIWMQTEDENKIQTWRPSTLRIPTLEGYLRQKILSAKNSDVYLSKDLSEFHEELLYLSSSRLTDVNDIFDRLFAVNILRVEDRGNLLLAFSFQFSGRGEDTQQTLMEGARRVVMHILKDDQSSLTSIVAVKALYSFTSLFPEEMRKVTSGEEDSVQVCTTALQRNLSSNDYTLRKESANLLFAVHESRREAILKDKEESDNQQGEDGLLKTRLEKLRSSLGGQHNDLSNFYNILRFVMEVDKSLVNIQSKLRLLQELGRILRDREEVNPVAIEASIHFSIGLLRTPLKVMWSAAAEIWGAATCHSQDVGMAVIVNHMEHAQNELLKERSQITAEVVREADEEGSGDIDEADNQNNIEESSMTSIANEVEAGPTMSTTDHDPLSKLNIHTRMKKRPRSESGALKGRGHLEIVSKRQRARDREIALKTWDHSEYESFCNDQVDQVISSLRDLWKNRSAKDTDLDRTNCQTFLQQLLRALSKEPKYILPYRSKIIELYLQFDSSLLSRRIADLLITHYATLLEKMGGLKSCESDRDLERRMRDRLLADMTRPNAPLQTAVFRCLCGSRAASLRPHRDSFVRLIEETTFREELTVLTEALFPNWGSTGATSLVNPDSELVLDVLVRICFSKMMGKRTKMDSRRAAVLSFIASKLPGELALSRIVSLAISPIADVVKDLKPISLDGLSSFEGKLPPLNVQLGVLSSIESVLKHCKRSLSSSSWQQIARGSFLLLRSTKGGGAGQNVRSRTLRILGEMCCIRPNETAFLLLPAIKTVKGTNFDMNAQGDGQGAPALLHFISSVYRTDLLAIQKTVVTQESWVLEWSLRFLEAKIMQVNAIDLSLSIAGWLVSARENFASEDAMKKNREDQALYKRLLSVLASSLKSLLIRLVHDVMGNRMRQKAWTHVFESALGLTEQLTRTDSVQSDVLLNLCEGLTSYVFNINSVSSLAPGTLKALTAIATVFCNSENKNIVDKTETEVNRVRNLVLQLLPKFGDRRFTQDPASYEELCNLFASLGLQEFLSVSSVLRSINAMDGSRLDYPDIDKRIDGLNLIIKGFKDALGDVDNVRSSEVKEVQIPAGDIQASSAPCSGQAILALVYGCIAAVSFDDIAVRGTSSYALQLLTKWVAVSSSTNAKECWAELFGLLLESTVSAKTSILRREFCQSLAELVEYSDKIENDKSCPNAQVFLLLRNATRQQDQESNFFHNLVHMQAHRRGRALRWLEKELLEKDAKEKLSGTEEFNARVLLASRFAFPLGLHMALELDDIDKQSNRPSHHNDVRESARKDVVVWAISLVGASAQWLPWPEYKSTIIGLMRRLKGSAEDKQDDLLYKVIVKVAEGFPLLENEESLEYTPRKQFLVDVLLPKLLSHVNKADFESDLIDAIGKNSVGKKGAQHGRRPPTVFRAPMAIAAGHLLTRLPKEDIGTFISLLVNPLANALRSRMITTRDSAKKALITVLLMLGPKYLLYVLRQVLAALSQGFRKDACVYVIHAILLAVREHNYNPSSGNSSGPFVIDDACGIIASYLADEFESGMSVIMNDFQDPNVSSTRQKQAFARAAKALECEEMLAELISFDKSAQLIIKPLNRLLAKSSSAKLSSRVENALQKLVIGFSRNTSMIPKNAIRICRSFILPTINGKTAAHDEKQNTRMRQLEAEPHDELSGVVVVDYRMAKFGFLLLKSILNKNMPVLSGKSSGSAELQSMLEPFLPLVVEALQTKHDSLKLLALQVAQKLLKIPLRKRKDVAENMSEIIVDVLSQNAGVSTHNDDLFNSCLRAAAILFHEVGENGLKCVPTERVEALVTIACNCIENGSVDARTAALVFLRATVSARIVIPAVYDAVEKVNNLAIRAQSTALRSACTSLSIAFMTSFPVGSKRVRQQLEFFVRNLNYELADGRLAALEALNTIILKFPTEVLGNECEYLFVALTASMARDLDGRCRSSSSIALQRLFQKVPAGRKVVDMLKMASVLLGSESSMSSIEENVAAKSPKDAEVALSGALAFTAACRSSRLTLTQLGLVARVLLAALSVSREKAHWEVTYALLQGLETCFNAQGEVSTSNRLEVQMYLSPLWKMMPRLLLDKHQWIRLSSARLLGKHLSASGGREAKREQTGTNQFSVFWSKEGLVRSLLRTCCLQLEANHLSEDLGQQCLKNVLCIGDVVFKNASIGDVSPAELSAEGAAEEQEQDDEREGEAVTKNRGIRWLVFRMSGLGMKVGEEAHEMLRRGCALRFLLVTANWWGMEFVKSNAEVYIAPVVKILESSMGERANKRRDNTVGKEVEGEGGGEVDGLCELGMRLQDALVEGLGATKYYEVYQEIRNKRESVRNARKRQAAFENAVNPERAAKKRRRRAEKRKFKRRTQSSKASGEGDDVEAVLKAKEQLTADL